MWDAKGMSALKFHGQGQPFHQCSVGKYAEQGRRGIQTVFAKMQRTPNTEEKRTIASQVVPVVKKRKPICQCRRCMRLRFDTWVGIIPMSRKWKPTPVLPGKFHGQRSLVGYSPWGHKE